MLVEPASSGSRCGASDRLDAPALASRARTGPRQEPVGEDACTNSSTRNAAAEIFAYGGLIAHDPEFGAAIGGRRSRRAAHPLRDRRPRRTAAQPGAGPDRAGRARRRGTPRRPVAADLSVDLGRGLVLANPILVASGTFGYGIEYGDVVDVQRIGAICCKGTTLKPRVGNPPPRVTETPGGMLNSIGLQNPGVDAVDREVRAALADVADQVLVNVSGESIADYVEVARRLDGVPGVAGIELNISCPNVGKGGIQFAIDASAAGAVTAAVRRATDLPLLVKLSPNVADVRPIAKAIEEAGADAITAVNTLSGIAIDPGRRAAAAGQRVRRPLRPGDQAGGAADRLRDRAGREDPDRGDRRHHRAGRRTRLPRGRRRRGPGGHGDLRGPDGAGAPLDELAAECRPARPRVLSRR